MFKLKILKKRRKLYISYRLINIKSKINIIIFEESKITLKYLKTLSSLSAFYKDLYVTSENSENTFKISRDIRL